MQFHVLLEVTEGLNSYVNLCCSDFIWKIVSPGIMKHMILFYYTEEQKRQQVGKSHILHKAEEIVTSLEEYPLLTDKEFYSITIDSKEMLDMKYEGHLLNYVMGKF